MGFFDRLAAKATPYADEYDDYEEEYGDDDAGDYDGEEYYDDAEVASLQPVTSAPEVARIVTVWVASFNETETFAREYRNGLPIVLNLSEAPDAQRNRIIDFALGLTYGLEGVFSHISDDVFLLTPKSVKIETHGSESQHYFK
ncbi:cell division inhibitor SepF [Trueperella bonasi]|uniref:Cell division protein SepF n=1 Tax=Trueperella bonasi TaxID=312286 RepID=A0ABT9NI03_9ACTO|nr:cell division protein SepF [Trueperella bonasi]MDP9807021.1 cell division inhibitor SepF [Trueperella bonasi]